MRRKILISFSDQFIIDYLVNHIYTEWKDQDCIYILSTGKNNHLFSGDFNCDLKFIDISNGKDEDEFWEIFESLYALFQEEDEVNIDISFCPRIVEMLLASLIQYTKLLKNISVNGVYYCVVENGFPCKHINLTAFSTILDWSIAANDIINFGSSERFNAITSAHIHPVLRKTCGRDEAALKLKKMNNNIRNLSWNIKTNRGKNIIESMNAHSILESLDLLEQDLILPLNPILKKIRSSVSQIYSGKNKKENMLSVVQWCIDKSLLQEGYTLLQEGIISYFLTDYNDKTQRELTSAYLNYRLRDNFNIDVFSHIDKKIINNIQKQLDSVDNIDEWSAVYSHLTELRNDINHAGMMDYPASSEKFEKKLIELYGKVKELADIK